MTLVREPREPPRTPRIWLVPAMPVAAPYDDDFDDLDGELGPVSQRGTRDRPSGQGVQGALALDFGPASVPAVPTPPPRLRLIGRDLVSSLGTPPTAPNEALCRRPDPVRWAATMVQAANRPPGRTAHRTLDEAPA